MPSNLFALAVSAFVLATTSVASAERANLPPGESLRIGVKKKNEVRLKAVSVSGVRVLLACRQMLRALKQAYHIVSLGQPHQCRKWKEREGGSAWRDVARGMPIQAAAEAPSASSASSSSASAVTADFMAVARQR